jgi:hypothetical protein
LRRKGDVAVRKTITAAFLMMMSFSVSAEMEWLTKQLSEPRNNSQFIKSYEGKNQSYVYDQALAILVFSHNKDFKKAQSLIQALANVQNSDGSWYFSYYLDGKSPHPAEGDMRPMGAIAWAALAIMSYEKLSKDSSFHKTWVKALKHIEKNMIKPAGLNVRGVRFSEYDNSKTHWDERNVAALEHAIDSSSAFKLAFELTNTKKYYLLQMELEEFVMTLWDQDVRHFWSGINLKSGKINRSEFYLDNQSWTALALKHTNQDEKIKAALEASCSLMVKDKDLIGFTESRSNSNQRKFIWSEGTAGKAMALSMYDVKCDETESSLYSHTLENMKENGGVKYIDRKKIKDFSDKPSVAGTSWTWFLKQKVNPFNH